MPYYFKTQEGFLKMSPALPPVHMSIILLDTHLQISILQSSPCNNSGLSSNHTDQMSGAENRAKIQIT